MRLTIIIAAIIIAVAIMLSNGIYVPMGQAIYMNKFTGECFNWHGERLKVVDEKEKDMIDEAIERASEKMR